VSETPAPVGEYDGPLYAAAARIYPQKVDGVFRRAKWAILFVCLGIYYFLPFLRWDRGPNLPDQAVLIDLANRRFYFFFIELWPQEIYYFTGLMVLAALILFMMNAIAGRVWCGYLCPQTVWTDLFMQVERLIEGDRRERIRRDEGPWTFEKVYLKATKHLIWLLIAWWTGGAWVLYFADAPTLVKSLANGSAPAMAWIWIGILTTTTYLLAGHMREQVCLYMCPWPRIQAALTDEHALNVAYRYDRGEPRASVKSAAKLREAGQPAGDCIDCNQCVAVCPTGVDIREGSQLGCIQCGLCIDACDTVMRKVGRPERLIAYDTDVAIKARAAGETPPRFRALRPRTLIYLAIIAIAGGAMLWTLATRALLEISALHDRAPLFLTLKDGSIRNGYTVRVLNKRSENRLVVLSVTGLPGAQLEAVGMADTADWRAVIEVPPDTTREVSVFISAPREGLRSKTNMIWIKAADLYGGETATAKENFFAP
jgi:cytochrome c oxidase accessory protein FixG